MTIFDRAAQVGGVATTAGMPWSGGEARINDQVQGGTPSFKNTQRLFEAFGFSFTRASLQVAIGTDRTLWTNTEATAFLRAMRPDVRRFGRLLALAQRVPPAFVALSIDTALRVGGFSDDFRLRVVYPLMSLFFGSGIDSDRIPVAIVAHLFLDAQSRLFDFDANDFLASAPQILAFPNLTDVYTKIATTLRADVELGANVTSVSRHHGGVMVTCEGRAPREFDAIVFACPADRALEALSDASVLERLALGSVEFGEGVLVTHTDHDYLRRHYGGDPASGVHYYARNDPHDPSRVESTYNLSRYQPQLAEKGLTVLQTVDPFDRVDPEKIIVTRRFRHNNHSAKHFTRMLPLLRLTQGRHRTYFAGSYTMLNAHEIAIISGFAAAERLGAPYPFREDPEASQPYDMYRKLLG